ncbi:MAG: hypothetical protein FWG44_07440 [Oscillospiraceae bacterium]|nr:hypothetical protein [Oscillospiraceae bacterium]
MAWDTNIINMDEALSRVLGRKELYKGWLDSFFRDENFTPVAEAFEKKDREELRLALHKIKGTAGNLSVTTVFNQSLKISTSVKAGEDLDGLSGEIEKLKNDFYEAKKMYEENANALIHYGEISF